MNSACDVQLKSKRGAEFQEISIILFCFFHWGFDSSVLAHL